MLVIKCGGCSVKLALANVSKRPVFRNKAMNTPLVIEASISDLVASLTHASKPIMIFLSTILIAMITKEIELLTASPVYLMPKYLWQISVGWIQPKRDAST